MLKKSFTILTAFATLWVLILVMTTCKKGDDKQVVVPTITTKTPTNITQTSATVGGYISEDGGATVSERGICYSTSQNPTVADLAIVEGGGTGTFSCDLTGLSSNTKYYAKAYGINSAGVGYGSQVNFTTIGGGTAPTVTTTSITSVTETSATGGGNVTAQGSSPVISRGICWSTSSNPTTSDSHTTNGSGTGSFTSNITGLTANTPYYVRAYAINNQGTAYGNQVSFTTTGSSNGEPCPGTPTVTYEGKTYNTVQIGTQCWFKENLNVGTRINGSQVQSNNGVKEKYCYGDLESNCDIYGGLYQWDEAMQYVITEGVQGICPAGWHLPTDAEWSALTTFLGGESIAGGKMKEAGFAHWSSPNAGATNSSGFTALPGGGRNTNGYFYLLTSNAYFWSSSQYDTSNAWLRHLYCSYVHVDRSHGNEANGFSARCVQD
jgi:uncharacterized protein (TIGR02145 family)